MKKNKLNKAYLPQMHTYVILYYICVVHRVSLAIPGNSSGYDQKTTPLACRQIKYEVIKYKKKRRKKRTRRLLAFVNKYYWGPSKKGIIFRKINYRRTQKLLYYSCIQNNMRETRSTRYWVHVA